MHPTKMMMASHDPKINNVFTGMTTRAKESAHKLSLIPSRVKAQG